MSWKETLPNPSAEPFPMPAGAAGCARGSPGTCHPPPRATAGIPPQNKQVTPPSSSRVDSLPCSGWIPGCTARIPLAQPGRVWLLSPESFPQPTAPSRRVPSLLLALFVFPGLKLKEKQLPTFLGNFKLLESWGWVRVLQPPPRRGIILEESDVFKEKFYFQPCDPQGEETSQTARKSRKNRLLPLRGWGFVPLHVAPGMCPRGATTAIPGTARSKPGSRWGQSPTPRAGPAALPKTMENRDQEWTWAVQGHHQGLTTSQDARTRPRPEARFSQGSSTLTQPPLRRFSRTGTTLAAHFEVAQSLEEDAGTQGWVPHPPAKPSASPHLPLDPVATGHHGRRGGGATRAGPAEPLTKVLGTTEQLRGRARRFEVAVEMVSLEGRDGGTGNESRSPGKGQPGAPELPTAFNPPGNRPHPPPTAPGPAQPNPRTRPG
ncbi:translation initiation factor IF-2-like [Corvus kubaryi]|uniref:translation initiation factor IF-2-like n=1 Tax=Corvus kubaryi TaxID=68294 RepID=UPI001C05ACBC|nr:translation initiation factor IF-2-like [Corvus kubaryi]